MARKGEHAGLVSVRVEGREHLYTLETRRLEGVVSKWLGWFQD